MATPTWCSAMETARKSSITRAARSRWRTGNPQSKEGAHSHETGTTGLYALCLRPGHYLGGDYLASYRATGLPCLACVLRKGGIFMRPTPDERLSTNHEQLQHQTPSTGQGANKARLETVLPTALAGPAQQGREPCPIILPRIAIGVSVAPHIPALPAARASVAAPLALEHRPTLVLAPVTNEGKGQETGAHEPHSEEEDAANEPIAPPPPPAVPGQERGYPAITTPIPTPGDLHRTTPFPSAPAQQWSARVPRLFLVRLGSGLFLSLLALFLVAVFVAPVATLAATVTLVPETKTPSTSLTVTPPS